LYVYICTVDFLVVFHQRSFTLLHFGDPITIPWESKHTSTNATRLDLQKLAISTTTMRIHLSLDPKHLVQGVAGPSSGPLVNIGGDLVLVELQGELNHEGDKEGGVVGILGLDRPVSVLLI
jgi:hypothetical protein